MITASGNYVMEEGAKLVYSELAMYVTFRYDPLMQDFLCEIKPTTVTASGSSVVKPYTKQITKASVDAKTGTGTNPSDKLSNQVDQVIADYLDGLTENAALSFTVS